jgi:GntR family transcriptional regulator
VSEAQVADVRISAAPDPLYHQVYDAIAGAIREGTLKPGDRLPPERSFCEQFGVSRATIRRALRRLVEEGIVEATVGRGSFVSAGPLTEPPNALISFTELAAARGLHPSAVVLSKSVRPASLEEAGLFKIDLQALVFNLERLRLLDGRPVAIERTRVPLGLAPALVELDFADASIYTALESAGALPITANVVVSASSADEARAAALAIEAGAPLITCAHVSYDSTSRLVEIGEITYRADRYQFRARLTRQNDQASLARRG